MKKRNRFTAILTAVLVCLAASAAYAYRVTLDDRAEGYGLKTGESSLILYLKDGIPEDSAGSPLGRWQVYWFIAEKLGEVKSKEALPMLIARIQDPLPYRIQSDLDLHVASHLGHRSWEDWDREYARELAQFREGCAMALAKIGDNRALPALVTYQDSLSQTIESELAGDNPYSSLMRPYSTVCRAITALGSKEGIDALIATLDRLPQRDPEPIIDNLRICTGQPFGPEYSQPLHTRAAEISKWKEWWEQNRETWRIDRDRVLGASESKPAQPVPESLRDHVAAAITRESEEPYEVTGYGRRSALWLEANGQARVGELVAIVNDIDEDSQVRGEALLWYARFGGSAALDLLAGYAVDDDRYSEVGPGRIYLQIKALEYIEGLFPNEVDRVARKCLFSRHQVSGNAARILMKNPKNYLFVAENYANVRPTARYQIFEKLLQLSGPLGRKAFFEAVKDEDVHTALDGVRGIQKFGLEDELPQESREALARLRKDPEYFLLVMSIQESYEEIFRLGESPEYYLLGDISEQVKQENREAVARFREDSEYLLRELSEAGFEENRVARAREILQLLEKTDAHAARTYARAWDILRGERRDFVLEGLKRCIDAYKKSRD